MVRVPVLSAGCWGFNSFRAHVCWYSSMVERQTFNLVGAGSSPVTNKKSFYGVMDSITDYESVGLGSIPSRRCKFVSAIIWISSLIEHRVYLIVEGLTPSFFKRQTDSICTMRAAGEAKRFKPFCWWVRSPYRAFSSLRPAGDGAWLRLKFWQVRFL